MKSRVLAGLLSFMLVVSATEGTSLKAFATDGFGGTVKEASEESASYESSEEVDTSDVFVEVEDEEEDQAGALEIAEESEDQADVLESSEESENQSGNLASADEDKIEIEDEKDGLHTEGVAPNPPSDFKYKVDNDQVTITKYVGTGAEVVIPDTIGGVPVVAIDENAFKDNDVITYVRLPKDLESIGEYAFYECSNLGIVEFNEGLKTTEKYSFGYCAKLEEVLLPKSLTKLGDQVFAHCTSLIKVFIPKGLNNVELAPFRACPLKTIEFEEGITKIPGTTRGYVYSVDGIFGDSGIEEVVIPDTVEVIGDDAFHDCAKLKKVTLPKSLKTIEGYAFADCTSLEEAKLPEGIEKIKDSAYRGCKALKEVYLPKTLTEIQDRAFYDTFALTKVTFEEGTTTIFGTNAIYEDIGVFANSGLEEVTIPDSVTKIEECAFAGCGALRTIKLSKNITSIGAKAFYNCERLDGVVLPEGITVIQDRLFFNCASLTAITIPSKVTEIQELAFKGCKSLESIYIPKNVETIEKQAFMGDLELGSVEFETHNLYTTTQKLGEDAFNECTSLTDVQLGNRIKKIEKNTFASCTSLKEIQIPYGVTEIVKGAFAKCHNLEILFIPSSVKDIGTTDDEFERSYSHVPLVYYEKDTTTVKIYATALGWDTEVGIWNVDFADAAHNEFPDKSLNNQLYVQRVDKNIDTRLTLREIEATKELNVPNLEIEDATGIQLLTSLEVLDISGNKLPFIDLSKNDNLKKLNIADNKLFVLDLSDNKKLSDLTVGQQSAVGTITSNDYFDVLLDLPAIYGAQYKKAAVDGITDEYLASGEGAFAEPEGIAWKAAYHVPDFFSYKYSVSYGSGATKTMAVDATITNAGLALDSKELATAYPDGNFRTAIFAALDTNKNEKLSRTEERSAKDLDVSKREIASIAGVERFWNLETLRLDSNKIAKVDLKNNKNIKELYVGGNALAAIDTSALTALETFRGGKQAVSFDGEKKDKVRTVDVAAYDSSFAKDKVSGVKALDADGNETDKVVTVTEKGFTMAGSVPGFTYTYAATKGDMQVTVKITGELDPEDPDEPVPVVTMVTVKFTVDDKVLNTVTIEEGDTIAELLPEDKDVEAAIPEGNTFIGWYVEGTDTRWEISKPVKKDLSLVARYVKSEDVLDDDDDGRDPGLKPTVEEEDKDKGRIVYSVYMVKGQNSTLPLNYEDTKGKITWNTSDKKTVNVNKNKVTAKKVTGADAFVQVYDGTTPADSKFVYNIRVLEPTLVKISGTSASKYKATTITVGNTLSLGIRGLGTSEKYAEFYNVSWYSSNPEVAKVEDGVVTGYAKGSAKISAYVNGKAYTGTVKIVESDKINGKISERATFSMVPLQTVTLKPSNTNLKVKNLTWYVVRSGDKLVPMKAYDKKGKEATTKISYYQNNVVRITTAGKLTAVGVGTTSLAAKGSNGAVMYVTVNVSSPVTNTVYLNVGKKKTLKYYSVKIASKDAILTSSKEAVTGKCEKGKVTGAKAGTATVTCKYDPYKTGNPIIYKTLVIVEDPKLVADKNNRLQVDKKSSAKATLELNAGERYAINSNVKYQSIIFTSSKTDVAFVNDAGVIIAKTAGKSKITAKVNGKTLTISLVVK